MIIINIQYKKDIAAIDNCLSAHRNFLQKYYDQGLFLASGPKEPRTGGIIIALMDDVTALKNIMQQDPFLQNDVATYDYIRFNPVKYRDEIAAIIGVPVEAGTPS